MNQLLTLIWILAPTASKMEPSKILGVCHNHHNDDNDSQNLNQDVTNEDKHNKN